MPSEQAVERFVTQAANGEGDAPPVVRPALKTLLYDLAALFDPAAVDRDIEYGLRTGFPDLRRLVEWYQRALVRTFGHITDEWEPESLVIDRTLIAATVDDPPDVTDPLPPAKAEALRDLYESAIVLPACVDAYADLRTNAGEYVGTDGQNIDPYDLDPERQANVAMRPGYQVLDRQQRHALTMLWGGFEDRRDFLTWLESLNGPMAGEVGDTLTKGSVADTTLLKYCVREPDSDRARAYRVWLAATHLLPGFADGVRAMSAGEAIQMKREETAPVPQI